MTASLNLPYVLAHHIADAFHESDIDASLAPLSRAIGEAQLAIDRATLSTDVEYRDAVVDSECDLIENHLGSAFVICQTFASAVVSRVRRIQIFYRRETGNNLHSLGADKYAIWTYGSPRIGGSPYTGIQLINAFANYFKHREEWGSWSHPSKRDQIVIHAVGARDGCTGNLRIGATVLGNESFDNLHALTAILCDWKSAVHQAYERELRVLGAIP